MFWSVSVSYAVTADRGQIEHWSVMGTQASHMISCSYAEMAMWLCFIDYRNTMPLKAIGLFNAWAGEAQAQKEHSRHINEVLAYCTSRFRAALAVLVKQEDDTVEWMQEVFFLELV